MNISEMYTSFASEALRIPGFKLGQKEDVPYDIQELADMYLLAEDQGDRQAMSMYFSALMIRYWHMTSYLYNKSDTLAGITREDMVDWLADALLKAFKYRSWQDPSKAVSKDKKKGAEKCFNQCITSMRQFWFKHYNQLKRKDDKELQSLDDEAYPGSDKELKVTLMDTVGQEEEIISPCDEIIGSALDSGKLLAALVADGIVNRDTFVNGKGGIPDRFSLTKMYAYLSDIPAEDIWEFAIRYGVDEKAVMDEADRLRSIKPAELRERVHAAKHWIWKRMQACTPTC